MIATPAASQGPRWALIARIPEDRTEPLLDEPFILVLTEDCAATAATRGWLILATETDVFMEPV
mgnify:FL=1